MGKTKTNPFHLFAFLTKCEKNVAVINNDGEHTRKIQDAVSLLQLFSCNCEADS